MCLSAWWKQTVGGDKTGEVTRTGSRSPEADHPLQSLSAESTSGAGMVTRCLSPFSARPRWPGALPCTSHHSPVTPSLRGGDCAPGSQAGWDAGPSEARISPLVPTHSVYTVQSTVKQASGFILDRQPQRPRKLPMLPSGSFTPIIGNMFETSNPMFWGWGCSGAGRLFRRSE